MKNTTINRAAHKLLNNGKIEARIGELLEEGRKRHDITVGSLTEQLDAYGFRGIKRTIKPRIPWRTL